MKAVLCTRYGPPEVLQLQEVEDPVPKDDEVLVRIRATTVSSGDARMRAFDVPPLPAIPYRFVLGFSKPRKPILGSSFAGEVAAIGKDVTAFKVGDQICGSTNFGAGTHAEYTVVPEDGILGAKPIGMSYEEAAALFFGGHTALHFLRKGKIKSGQNVCIYGASGAVGTYAVQLAKYHGAYVSAVCSSANVDLVRSLGADTVFDYTKEDFTRSGETYDILFDTVGKSPFSGSLESLKKDGVYLRAVHMTLGPLIRGLWTNVTSSRHVIGGVASEHKEDLLFLTDLVEKEKLRPVIDRSFPLSQIVEAHRLVDSGHKKGSVVVTVD